jgi:uridine kinase
MQGDSMLPYGSTPLVSSSRSDMAKHVLVIIAGPQGCGKSQMARLLQEAFEEEQQAGFVPADTTLKIVEQQVEVGETLVATRRKT